MKKLILSILMLCALTYSTTVWAIWTSPITTSAAFTTTYYLGDKVNSSGNWWFQFEIGEDGWNSSQVVYGQGSDPASFASITATYYGDGSGSNKKVQANIKDVQFTNTGTWYFVGRVRKNASDSYAYANSGWAENAAFNSSTCPKVTVLALGNPENLEATPASTSAITLKATEWLGRRILVVRYPSGATPTSPVNTTAYTVGNTLGTGQVVFNNFGSGSTNADAATFTDNQLNAATTYDYYFYSENYTHYSAGAKISATTNPVNPTWFGDSYMKIGSNWYNGSQVNSNPDFSGADLGTFTQDFTFESGIFVDPDNATTTVTSHYSIDNGSAVDIPMTKAAIEGNHARYETGLNTIVVAGLAYGDHTLKIWYTLNNCSNATEEAGYTANFTVGRVQLSDNLTINGDLIISTKSQIVGDNKTITANKIYIKHTVATSDSWEFISLPFEIVAVKNSSGAELTQNGNNGPFGLAYYDGVKRANTGTGWEYYPTTPLSAGAYAVWVDKSQVPDGVLLFEGNNTSIEIKNSHSGSVTHHTGSAGAIHDGWNLISHPLYATATATIGAGQFYYIYNGMDYDVETTDKTVAPFTSYFVKTAAAGSHDLTFNTITARVSSAAQSVSEKLTLWLNDTYKTVVRLNENALPDYDDMYDAPYMPPMSSSVPQIYTLNNAGKMAINTIPESTNIPLGFYFTQTGEYTLTWDNQLIGSNVSLIDNAGETVDMLLHPSYSFTINAAGEINNRFSIGINRLPTGLIQTQGNVKVYTENQAIVVSGLNKTAAVRVYDLAGRTIADEITASSLRIPAPKGIYVVSVDEKRFKLINQ